VSLFFHTAHGQFASVIHGLCQHSHFLVLRPCSHLIADMIDGAADDEPDWVETSFFDEQKLTCRKVACEKPPVLLILTTHLDQPLLRMCR